MSNLVAISSASPAVPAAVVSKKHRPSDDRIPVLDGIRGIAVLLVLVFHFWMVAAARSSVPWERVYGDIAGVGWSGVDLFFVLSGFLITGILYDSRKSAHYFRVFYGRRTVRIFPLYYAALAIFFLIGPFVLARIHEPVLADLRNTRHADVFAWTYLLNWYAGIKGWNAVPRPLQHFWSLSVEEQFYLVWPFLVLKVSRRRLMAVCVALMAAALILRIFMYSIHYPFAAYTWTICRADSLAMGAAVALASRDAGDWQQLLKWARRLVLPAFCAVLLVRFLNPKCAAGPGDSPTFFMNTIELTLLGIFFASCVAIGVSSEHGSPGHRVLASHFLRFFGKYSYCLYVCHMPVILVFAKAGLNTDHLVGIWHSELLSVLAVNGVGFAVSIAIAFTSWHLYEKQWLKLKERRGLQRQERLPPKMPVQSEYPLQGLQREPALSADIGSATGTGESAI